MRFCKFRWLFVYIILAERKKCNNLKVIDYEGENTEQKHN